MADAAVDELQQTIREAAAAQRALRVRGGGTKDFYGRRTAGDVVDTRAVSGIVSYAPTELVLTARSGTPLAEVESALDEARQMLPFEPPRFDGAATLGGAIAAGLSGPRRPYAGAARDFVLGVRMIDGTGEALAFGGRVMKNVAGFDVARLMTGSLGTLGVLTEVSLKCLPRPAVETTIVRECSADEAIRRVNEWGGQPLPLSATCWLDGRLWVRLSGAAPAVSSAREALGGEEAVDAERFWSGVRDHTHPFFTALHQQAMPLWRLSVRSPAPFRDLGREQLIEWGGALRWLGAPAGGDDEKLRAFARANGGHATCFRDGSGPVFQPLSPPMLALHQRLKTVFDPHGILNRGRLYPEL